MQSLLVDEGNNVPKDEDSFKKVGDDKIRDKCNFQKVCVLKITETISVKITPTPITAFQDLAHEQI